MKKIIRYINVILVLCLCVTFSACSSNYKENYDQELVNMGKESLDSWEFVDGRTYSVKLEKGIYIVDINGDIQMVQIEDSEPENIGHTITKDVTDKKVLKIVQDSKNLIIDYIQKSSVLNEKEKLCQSVENIGAKYTDANLVAEYANGIIYVNKKNKNDVCEWMIVHELVHYLCELTNEGIENEQYPYALFNEIMTDLITASMNPKINNGIVSSYSNFYDAVLPYIGCFEIEAIEAYYYGYDSIFKKVGKTEFDFYVHAIDQFHSNPLAEIVISNSINKWGLELKK